MPFKKAPFITACLVIITVLVSSSSIINAGENQPGNTKIDSFNESKKLLHRVIYKESEHRKDIYCGCSYDDKKEVDFTACG